MVAARYRFRAELRARWRSVLALALLGGLAGGVTLAAIAGARRTDSAFSRLLAATDAAQVLVNPDYGNDSGIDWDAVGRLPMVEAAGIERGIIVQPLPIKNVQELDGGLSLALVGDAGVTVARPLVHEGRVPDRHASDEVLVNPLFANTHGLGVGDRFDALVLGQDDIRTIEESGVPIADAVEGMNDGTYGTRVSLRVAGIGEVPEDIVVDEGFEDALVTAVRRRRRDLALLKTLGFTRKQVSASVAWQATTLGAASLLIGVPVGVILGRWAWTALADDLGTVAEPIVPLVAVVSAIPLVLLVANAVAFGPGRIAARTRPATVLRSE